MKNGYWSATLAGLYGAGAMTMYFFDPQRGKRRRVALKDALVHSGHEIEKFAGRFRRDFLHRVEGAMARTESVFNREEVDDCVLEQRVRTALGRAVSHPHGVEVSCKDGSVTLRGWILADELADLDKAVESVRGVKEVSTLLNTTGPPEQVSVAQERAPRKPLPEFLKENWSPTARVFAGGAGLGLMAYGARRREFAGAAAALGGAVLLARSIFNAPLRRIAGVGPSPGLRIQKTLRIAASAADLYEFWLNPENYPKVFPHVKQVTREGDGVYRWHVIGPAGVPLNWTAAITQRLPRKLVEWHSLPGAVIENHGVIRLDEEKGGRTRLHIQMSYTPPAGLLGHAVAALLGVDPKSLLDRDFVQLKAVFEQGMTRVRGHEVMAPELKVAHPEAS